MTINGADSGLKRLSCTGRLLDQTPRWALKGIFVGKKERDISITHFPKSSIFWNIMPYSLPR
jgi:hypothetical protein